MESPNYFSFQIPGVTDYYACMNLGLIRGLSGALVEYEEERASLVSDQPVRYSWGFCTLNKNKLCSMTCGRMLRKRKTTILT